MLVNYERHNLSLDEIKILIDAGANPRVGGDYALLSACSHGNMDIVKYFLNDCGSDINSHNSEALIRAISSENFKLVTLLLDYGIKTNDTVLHSCFLSLKTLKPLLNRAIDLEYLGKKLWHALKYNYLQPYETHAYVNYMKELVNHGVDFNKIIMG